MRSQSKRVVLWFSGGSTLLVVLVPGVTMPPLPAAALARRNANFKVRTTADPSLKCAQGGVPRAAARASQRITLGDGKTIDLKLPAGVEDGTQMRLNGKGEQGPGGSGDALDRKSVV